MSCGRHLVMSCGRHLVMSYVRVGQVSVESCGRARTS